jgi:hypothetical protein
VDKMPLLDHGNFSVWYKKFTILLQSKGLSHHLKFETFAQFSFYNYENIYNMLLSSIEPISNIASKPTISISTPIISTGTSTTFTPSASSISLSNHINNYHTSPYKPSNPFITTTTSTTSITTTISSLPTSTDSIIQPIDINQLSTLKQQNESLYDKKLDEYAKLLSANEYEDLTHAVDQNQAIFQPSKIFCVGSQPPIKILLLSDQEKESLFYKLNYYDYIKFLEANFAGQILYTPKYKSSSSQSLPTTTLPTTTLPPPIQPQHHHSKKLNSFEAFLSHLLADGKSVPKWNSEIEQIRALITAHATPEVHRETLLPIPHLTPITTIIGTLQSIYGFMHTPQLLELERKFNMCRQAKEEKMTEFLERITQLRELNIEAGNIIQDPRFCQRVIQGIDQTRHAFTYQYLINQPDITVTKLKTTIITNQQNYDLDQKQFNRKNRSNHNNNNNNGYNSPNFVGTNVQIMCARCGLNHRTDQCRIHPNRLAAVRQRVQNAFIQQANAQNNNNNNNNNNATNNNNNNNNNNNINNYNNHRQSRQNSVLTLTQNGEPQQPSQQKHPPISPSSENAPKFSGNVMFALNTSEAYLPDVNIYADSGSTTHIVTSPDELTNRSSASIPLIGPFGQPDNSRKTIGDLNLNALGGITLKKVVCVKDGTKNLISIPRLCSEEDMTFTMDKNGALGFKNGQPIMYFRINDSGLYALEEKQHSINGLIKNTMLGFHHIYGHACKDKLLSLFKANPKLSVIGTKDFECPTCFSEKIHQEPYAKFKPRNAEKIGDVIHTDVGFMPTSTIEGYNCYVTFMDEFTLYSWVYLMVSKSYTVASLKHFRKKIKTQFETTIKRVVLDNGPEYLTNEFYELLDKKGIAYDPIPINTQQLNGRAERLNRTLKESTRCLLRQANLEDQFWGFAFKYANTIRNMMPKKLLDNKSPYEMLFKKEPYLKKYKQFGLNCYYLDKTYKNALESKGKPALFLGIADNLYQLYDPEKEATIIA